MMKAANEKRRARETTSLQRYRYCWGFFPPRFYSPTIVEIRGKESPVQERTRQNSVTKEKEIKYNVALVEHEKVNVGKQ